MTGRDPRLQRMIDDPAGYFREARIKARAEAEEAIRRERLLMRRGHHYRVRFLVTAVVVVVAAGVAWGLGRWL